MVPESAEDYYARIVAAAGADGRLTYAPGQDEWEIFPLETPSWRVQAVEPLAEADPVRFGEDPARCWCATGAEGRARVVWCDDDWRVTSLPGEALPVMLFLEPYAHGDLADLPPAAAGRMGELLAGLAAAVEALPSVGRAHVLRWGDGSAHLHWWVMGRPVRMPQLRGSFLPMWADVLPPVPDDVMAENVRSVVGALVRSSGGRPV